MSKHEQHECNTYACRSHRTAQYVHVFGSKSRLPVFYMLPARIASVGVVSCGCQKKENPYDV